MSGELCRYEGCTDVAFPAEYCQAHEAALLALTDGSTADEDHDRPDQDFEAWLAVNKAKP